ncbi:MAG: AAA family ATPase [Pseudomonadota bacterium]
MILNKIRLSNFRCFDDFQLYFHPKLTVLVSDNGGGKTALLDAVAIALSPFVGGFDKGKSLSFSNEDVTLKPVSGESWIMEAQYPVAVYADASLHNDSQFKSVNWHRVRSSEKARTTIKDATIPYNFAKKLQQAVRQGSQVTLPLVAYYGTGRLWKQRKLTKTTKNQFISRTSGYQDCLEPASSYRVFAEWFSDITLADLGETYDILERRDTGVKIKEIHWKLKIRAIRQAVDTCLAEWHSIQYHPSLKEIVVRHPIYGQLSVHQLSDGLRNMVAMVADIAYRAVLLNPHLNEKAAIQTPGIVLIDEVDMHLHPRWQQTVVADLSKAFPNIQFIVTTHSPQVLSTVLPESICQLDWDLTGKPVVRQPCSSYGAESSRLLEDIQAVSPRPPHNEMSQALSRYFDLIDQDQWESEEAVALRQKLDKWSCGEEPELHRADMEIRRRQRRINR